jgi:hypothetical protein
LTSNHLRQAEVCGGGKLERLKRLTNFKLVAIRLFAVIQKITEKISADWPNFELNAETKAVALACTYYGKRRTGLLMVE